jgi:hypothetical protein
LGQQAAGVIFIDDCGNACVNSVSLVYNGNTASTDRDNYDTRVDQRLDRIDLDDFLR